MVGLRELSIVIVGVFCVMMGWTVGGLLGAVLGYVVGSILTFVPFESYDAIRRRRKWAQLRQFFGEYHAPEKQDEWEQTVVRLKPGDVVKGVVVHEGRSLVFVDIGCGFPAILSIAQVPNDRKKSADDSLEASQALLPAPGSQIEAQIMGFLPLRREIEITQGGRWLLLDGEIVGFLAYPEWPIEGRYHLRYTRSEAYDAFLKLPKSELASRCEVLTGDERQRVSVKRKSWSGYVYVSISLLEGTPSPP